MSAKGVVVVVGGDTGVGVVGLERSGDAIGGI